MLTQVAPASSQLPVPVPESRRSTQGSLNELDKPGLTGSITHTPTPPQVPQEDIPLAEANANASPIELCRRADEAKDRKAQIVALQSVWDEAFPEARYPVQRLTETTAKEFLVGRGAEEVGEVILRAAQKNGGINYPRAYVKRVLAETKPSKQPAPEEAFQINDDLRTLVQLGRKQFGEDAPTKAANSGGYKRGTKSRA